MKSVVKTVAMMAIVCVVALKAYSNQNEVQFSDVVLANVEALAEGEDGLGNVGITSGRWKRVTDTLGCYLKHICATDGDGYVCSPIGATTIIP